MTKINKLLIILIFSNQLMNSELEFLTETFLWRIWMNKKCIRLCRLKFTNTILFFRKHEQAKFISFYHQWTMERRVNVVRMGELWYDLAVERLKHFRMLHTYGSQCRSHWPEMSLLPGQKYVFPQKFVIIIFFKS